MRTPEQKAEMLRQQVISKIHWGARQQEVTEWLEEQHGIAGPEAERLLTEAYHARRKAVRERALIRLTFAVIGIALVVGFFYIRFFSGLIFYGPRSIIATALAIALGGYSFSVLVRSALQLLTGDTLGSVD